MDVRREIVPVHAAVQVHVIGRYRMEPPEGPLAGDDRRIASPMFIALLSTLREGPSASLHAADGRDYRDGRRRRSR